MGHLSAFLARNTHKKLYCTKYKRQSHTSNISPYFAINQFNIFIYKENYIIWVVLNCAFMILPEYYKAQELIIYDKIRRIFKGPKYLVFLLLNIKIHTIMRPS